MYLVQKILAFLPILRGRAALLLSPDIHSPILSLPLSPFLPSFFFYDELSRDKETVIIGHKVDNGLGKGKNDRKAEGARAVLTPNMDFEGLGLEDARRSIVRAPEQFKRGRCTSNDNQIGACSRGIISRPDAG